MVEADECFYGAGIGRPNVGQRVAGAVAFFDEPPKAEKVCVVQCRRAESIGQPSVGFAVELIAFLDRLLDRKFFR